MRPFGSTGLYVPNCYSGKLIAQLGIAIRYSPRWSTKDLEDLLARYLYSAKLCVEAGVDGIEIHGAHNVTLNHILSQRTNGRHDRYSDGLNLVREMVTGIRNIAPENLILSFRMGCCFDWDKDIRRVTGSPAPAP